MSDPPPPEVLRKEPARPDYRGRSDAFRRLMRAWGVEPIEGQQRVSGLESQVSDVMQVTDEELVILYRLHIQDIAIEAEVARRNIAALIAFKQESATASSRLQALTWWLMGFTGAAAALTCMVVVLTFVLAVLTVVLVVHDLTR